MHLAKLTTAGLKRTFAIISAFFTLYTANAQENSPYSRYGMGDIIPNQNIANRGMGGISAGYGDVLSLNFVNPASLGSIRNTIFDLGSEIDIRNLKSNVSPDKFQSVNTIISYLQLGVPLATEKMRKKSIYWGLSFGLRPVTKIDYKIEENKRVNTIDSLNTVYEGNGGITQANISTGLRFKNLYVGVSSGYTFGSKDYSTQLNFVNDSVAYFKSNTSTKTRFGGAFLNTGIQYDFKKKDTSTNFEKRANRGLLRVGAYLNLSQNLTAHREQLNETISFNGNGGFNTIDTVSYSGDEMGKVKLPMTYGVGFTFFKKSFVFGADLEMTKWNDYRFYGEKDLVQNSFVVRAGGQYSPAKNNTPISKYWSFVRYRAGVYYGKDYINLGGDQRSNYAVTLGAGLPLTSLQRSFDESRPIAILNTGIELGARGNKQSPALRENFARISIGLSMNATWFIKRKYF